MLRHMIWKSPFFASGMCVSDFWFRNTVIPFFLLLFYVFFKPCADACETIPKIYFICSGENFFIIQMETKKVGVFYEYMTALYKRSKCVFSVFLSLHFKLGQAGWFQIKRAKNFWITHYSWKSLCEFIKRIKRKESRGERSEDEMRICIGIH